MQIRKSLQNSHEFSSRYLKYKQLKKAWGSVIQPMIRECDDKGGFIHPLFNLHTVSTYRSSCSDPNLQQVSKHDKTMKSSCGQDAYHEHR